MPSAAVDKLTMQLTAQRLLICQSARLENHAGSGLELQVDCPSIVLGTLIDGFSHSLREEAAKRLVQWMCSSGACKVSLLSEGLCLPGAARDRPHESPRLYLTTDDGYLLVVGFSGCDDLAAALNDVQAMSRAPSLPVFRCQVVQSKFVPI